MNQTHVLSNLANTPVTEKYRRQQLPKPHSPYLSFLCGTRGWERAEVSDTKVLLCLLLHYLPMLDEARRELGVSESHGRAKKTHAFNFPLSLFRRMYVERGHERRGVREELR